MKRANAVAWGLTTLGILGLVIIGCDSMYSGSNTDTESTTSSGEDIGYFPLGSHSIEGGGPPVLAEEDPTEGEETYSHFRAIQIDPLYETSAGPKFVKPYDIDNDGMMDLISGWNQSQPVQIHLQRRDADDNIRFVTATLGGTGPIASLGGLEMADFNQDGWMDAAVLIKGTGEIPVCPDPGSMPPWEALPTADQPELQILYSPGNADDITDGDSWQQVRMARSRLLPGRRDVTETTADTFPENNSYTGLAVGDIDGINGPDIVAVFNEASCTADPPVNRVQLFANPGEAGRYSYGVVPLSTKADAGDDQYAVAGDSVSLDGSASTASDYYDPQYSWTQVAGTAVAITDANQAVASFLAGTTGETLTFLLTTTSGSATDFDHVNVVVGTPANYPPTVFADDEITVVPDEDRPGYVTATLNAVATDPDGDTLSYTWTQTAGDTVTLKGDTTSTAVFEAPEIASELRFRVTVSDGTNFDSALVTVVAATWSPVIIYSDLPTAGDVALSDVDLDGDDDIVFTYPDSLTANISWARNPTNVSGSAAALDPTEWEIRPVGHLDTYANVISIGDVDGDGYDDVLARSGPGWVVNWFRHPGAADLEPIFPPPDAVPTRFNFPWQVYTIAEYYIGKPAAVVAGDLTNDGLNDVAVSAGGVVYWYDSSVVGSAYERWGENFVVDDTKQMGTTDDPTDPDYADTGTVINNLVIVDLDGDGNNDVIATFDRRVNSGIADDTLIWFRNTISETPGVNQ